MKMVRWSSGQSSPRTKDPVTGSGSAQVPICMAFSRVNCSLSWTGGDQNLGTCMIVFRSPTCSMGSVSSPRTLTGQVPTGIPPLLLLLPPSPSSPSPPPLLLPIRMPPKSISIRARFRLPPKWYRPSLDEISGIDWISSKNPNRYRQTTANPSRTAHSVLFWDRFRSRSVQTTSVGRRPVRPDDLLVVAATFFRRLCFFLPASTAKPFD
mmetsp:Transcript_17163/g.39637  ORF Transcript_17163/g.39637 Transcript_17163/m.39637 type:complete len:209 (+) Transcript_17163:1275-1901(+)